MCLTHFCTLPILGYSKSLIAITDSQGPAAPPRISVLLFHPLLPTAYPKPPFVMGSSKDSLWQSAPDSVSCDPWPNQTFRAPLPGIQGLE